MAENAKHLSEDLKYKPTVILLRSKASMAVLRVAELGIKIVVNQNKSIRVDGTWVRFRIT